MACIYSDPVNYLGDPAGEGDFWNFKTLTCDTPQTLELLVNDSGSEFYLNKTISYGDLMLIFFFSIFIIFAIFKMLWNFIWQDNTAKL